MKFKADGSIKPRLRNLQNLGYLLNVLAKSRVDLIGSRGFAYPGTTLQGTAPGIPLRYSVHLQSRTADVLNAIWSFTLGRQSAI
jgi:hypothetical protein